MTDQMQLIISEANLDEAESIALVSQFDAYQTIATEWEARARTIVVTSAEQKAEMQLARTGRLFLKEKRVAIEKTRKTLKESSLRKGKAIDALAKYLTGMIEPTERYLEQQEKFIEIRAAQEAERIRKEEEAKAEADRIERERIEAEERAKKEAAEHEERRRLQEENERLRIAHEEQERLAREAKQLVEAERARAAEEKRQMEAGIAEVKAELADQVRQTMALQATEKILRRVACPACGEIFDPEEQFIN